MTAYIQKNITGVTSDTVPPVLEATQNSIKAIREATLAQKRKGGLAEKEFSSSARKQKAKTPEEIRKENSEKLQKASLYFPRVPFPWDVFPCELSESLKQLADSLGVLPDHIPDTAMAVLASIIGRRVTIKAKLDHIEQLILWFMDVRPAGSGKTPAQNKLTEKLREIQEKSDEDFEKEKEAWDNASEDEKKNMKEPLQARGYYATNYTSEGLRTALKNHPTGGYLLLIDEGSALISGQNAYKSGGKGSDRESLNELYNGNQGRVIRAKETHIIPKCAVSIAAGIQPEICKRTFGGDNGLYLVDGTIMRFCFTYSDTIALDIDSEVYWTEKNQDVWNNLILKAISFQLDNDLTGDPAITTLTFTEEARKYFYGEWRNPINRIGKDEIKISLIDGFIQKAVTNAIRFTGLVVLIKSLHEGSGIPFEIGIDDVQKGIKLAEFYLGQAVDIIKMFIGSEDDSPPVIASEELNNLAVVLQTLKDMTEKGMLSMGFIADKYNILFPARPPLSPNKVGNLVSMAKLTRSGSLQDIHCKKRVSCMIWDEKTDSFIKRVSRLSHSLLNKENQIVIERETCESERASLSSLSKLEPEREIERDSERPEKQVSRLQYTENKTNRESERQERCICDEKKFTPVFDEDDFVDLTTGMIQ